MKWVYTDVNQETPPGSNNDPHTTLVTAGAAINGSAGTTNPNPVTTHAMSTVATRMYPSTTPLGCGNVTIVSPTTRVNTAYPAATLEDVGMTESAASTGTMIDATNNPGMSIPCPVPSWGIASYPMSTMNRLAMTQDSRVDGDRRDDNGLEEHQVHVTKANVTRGDGLHSCAPQRGDYRRNQHHNHRHHNHKERQVFDELDVPLDRH